METVVLATDGSEYASAAAERAVDLAREPGATLHVLRVVDRRRFDEPALSSGELATVAAEDRARACIADVAALAATVEVEVEGVVRHGVPQDVILEYADAVDATVIVVGAHGDHDDHFGGVGRAVTDLSSREVVVADP